MCCLLQPPNWSRLNETMSQLRNARRSMAVKAADGTSNKRNLDEKVAAIVEMKRREVEDKAAAMQRQNGAGKDKSKEGNMTHVFVKDLFLNGANDFAHIFAMIMYLQ